VVVAGQHVLQVRYYVGVCAISGLLERTFGERHGAPRAI
jgi:hypothetical protein